MQYLVLIFVDCQLILKRINLVKGAIISIFSLGIGYDVLWVFMEKLICYNYSNNPGYAVICVCRNSLVKRTSGV